MASVTRLLTIVDLDDASDPGPDARTLSVSARHVAVLADGRRVVLLDDRGWTEAQVVARPPQAEGARDEADRRGIWESTTEESLERTARDVVGPDEPFGSRTQAEMEAGHWDALARTLRSHGVEVEAAELKALPHDVELSDRVRQRAGRRPDARR